MPLKRDQSSQFFGDIFLNNLKTILSPSQENTLHEKEMALERCHFSLNEGGVSVVICRVPGLSEIATVRETAGT